MRHLLRIAAALIGLAVSAVAEVPNGSIWIGGGHTTTVGVELTGPTSNTVTVTFTDDGVTSNGVDGTPGAGSSASTPTAEESDEVGGRRVHNGKAQYKGSDGVWRNMRKQKEPKPKRGDMERLVAGDPAPHAGTLYSIDFSRTIHMQAGDLAPWDGYWIGEEITSLP